MISVNYANTTHHAASLEGFASKFFDFAYQYRLIAEIGNRKDAAVIYVFEMIKFYRVAFGGL